MKKSEKSDRRPRAKLRKTPKGEYEVGYGKPPRENRFKPGQSGNPRGRPAGMPNKETMLTELFNRKVEIRERGRVRKIPMIVAAGMKVAEQALKGDPKAYALLLSLYESTLRDLPCRRRSDELPTPVITNTMSAQEAAAAYAAILKEGQSTD